MPNWWYSSVIYITNCTSSVVSCLVHGLVSFDKKNKNGVALTVATCNNNSCCRFLFVCEKQKQAVEPLSLGKRTSYDATNVPTWKVYYLIRVCPVYVPAR